MNPNYDEFDRRITIEKATTALDARKNEVKTWAVFYSCYAG